MSSGEAGRFVNFMDQLRFLRERELGSKETNYVGSTLDGNYGVARLGFAFLYLGSEPFGVDLSRRLEQLQLTQGGFELTGREFTNAALFSVGKPAARSSRTGFSQP